MTKDGIGNCILVQTVLLFLYCDFRWPYVL